MIPLDEDNRRTVAKVSALALSFPGILDLPQALLLMNLAQRGAKAAAAGQEATATAAEWCEIGACLLKLEAVRDGRLPTSGISIEANILDVMPATRALIPDYFNFDQHPPLRSGRRS